MSRVNIAQPDVMLTLDLAGIIRRAVFSDAMSSIGKIDWIGRPLAETVVESADAQVHRMLDDARTAGVSPFQELRQRFPGGAEIAVEYTAVRLGGDAGLLAIGRNLEAVADVRSRLLAARVSMERDSWKMRGVEMRYRQLFEASDQPVILLDASTLRIVEVNPKATRALGVQSGETLLEEIRESERAGFEAMLTRVREQGKAPAVLIHVRADRTPWLVRASLVAGAPDAVFILQLSPSGSAPYLLSPAAKAADVGLENLIARLPEPFVVVGADGVVARANHAFVDLVEADTEASVLGRSLDDWVEAPSSSSPTTAVLLREVERGGTVREQGATIKGRRGKVSYVAIAAVGNVDEKPSFVGLLLRRLDKASQRALVRAAVSSIERQCIEAVERIKGRAPKT